MKKWHPNKYVVYHGDWGIEVIIKIKDRNIGGFGSFYVTKNWCEIRVGSLKAIVPISRVKFWMEERDNVIRYIAEVEYLSDEDVERWAEWKQRTPSTPSVCMQSKTSRKKRKYKAIYKVKHLPRTLLKVIGLLFFTFLGYGLIFGVILVDDVIDYIKGGGELPFGCAPDEHYYSVDEAVKCYLNDPKEIRTLEKLASQLKGQTLQESAWNILEWEDEHIKYDWGKYHGLSSTTIQRPSETIQRGSGVCVDYAVLTAGLLLAMNYSPVYVFEIEFSNDPSGHAAAAIKINGEYFMLDQHPPALDLGSYYIHLAYYRKEAFNGTQPNLIISSAKVYEVRRGPDGVVVNLVGTLTASDFKKQNHAFSQADLTKIVNDLKTRFLREFPNLKLDQRIANLDTSRYLPPGYSAGRSWKFEFPNFAEYYNPVFHDQFVDYIYTYITDDTRVISDLKTYKRLWIKGRMENGAIKIILCLAKP